MEIAQVFFVIQNYWIKYLGLNSSVVNATVEFSVSHRTMKIALPFSVTQNYWIKNLGLNSSVIIYEVPVCNIQEDLGKVCCEKQQKKNIYLFFLGKYQRSVGEVGANSK